MRLQRRNFLALFAVACSRTPPVAFAPPHVLKKTKRSFATIVANGMVLDGLGGDARRADVGIRDGRIAAMGDLSGDEGVVIDARGLYVAPGFIDLHSHADETFLTYPNVESTVRQGVTTVLVGQDGFSLAPAERYATFADYQRELEAHRPAINVASMIGQGTIRRKVMGDRIGGASPRELHAMRALAEEALRAGAFGITSGLEYPPSANAMREELTELCRTLAPMRGVYMTHLRNEDDRLVEAIEEAIAIAQGSGARLHVSHLKASGQRNWAKLGKVFELLDAVGATADCYPYEAYATTLQNLFPASARGAGTKAFLDALRDPKSKLREAAEAKVAMLGSWNSVMFTGLRGTPRGDWDGKRVGDLATSLHRAPIDVVVDLLLEREGQVGMLGFGMSEENIARTIAHDRVAVASDGSALATSGPLSERKAHPRSYGTFPRVLGRLVREKKVLPLPLAVRKMTALPASILGLQERGALAAGFAADLVVFDPEAVSDRATYDQAHQYPAGIAKVLVNGELVLDGDRHTAARAGRVLR